MIDKKEHLFEYLMTEEIIEDCPDFMYGCCQKYLDGDCSAHKCDLKIIRGLKKKLERIEDRVQDLDNYSEKNVEIMNDIIAICQEKINEK